MTEAEAKRLALCPIILRHLRILQDDRDKMEAMVWWSFYGEEKWQIIRRKMVALRNLYCQLKNENPTFNIIAPENREQVALFSAILSRRVNPDSAGAPRADHQAVTETDLPPDYHIGGRQARGFSVLRPKRKHKLARR